MKSEDNVFTGWKMETSKTRCAKESKMESINRAWTAKPILSSEFTEDPPLHEVYIGILKDKKDISTAIPSMSSAMPGFHHLKRCTANKLLLAPLKNSKSSKDTEVSLEEENRLTQDELKSKLKEKGFDISVLENDFEIISVPSRAPKTKAQAVRASKIWPVNFHPDPNIESLIDGSILEEHQLQSIENYMKVAIEAASSEALGNTDCNGSAVIVDPEDGRILAIAASKMNLHPMWHASMIAVDLVAKLQGGGAWDFSNEKNSRETSPIPSETRNIDTKEKEKIIKRKYEEEAPLYYPKSLSKLRLPEQISLQSRINHKGRRNNSSSKKTDSDDVDTKSEGVNREKYGPYLCTGYWAFLLKEPCPLCAMALLHSRVLRIFYGVPNERTGVLGTNAILHAVPGLNHRYQVWSEVLHEESREVARIIDERIIS